MAIQKWKPFISTVKKAERNIIWISSTIEPYMRRNLNNYDTIEGIKFLMHPQSRYNPNTHKTEHRPDYTFITGTPFLVKVKYTDESEGFEIIFANSPGEAILIGLGSENSPVVEVKLLDASIQAVIHKEPIVLRDNIRVRKLQGFNDKE